MTLIESLIVGIVQGITEFLPVSSSGHLVITHGIFGGSEYDIVFDVLLHVATLGAVLIYFGKDLIGLITGREYKWIFYIAIGTVPAVFAALLFEDFIDGFFASPWKVGIMLMVTSAALFTAHLSLKKKDDTERRSLGIGSVLAVGIAQAFALLPGISRSGMTISAGLATGVKSEEAFKYSFFLSVPVVAAAALYKIVTAEPGAFSSEMAPNYLVGMAAAFVTGIASLKLLWWVIKKRKLAFLAGYCLLIGFLVIFTLR